MRTPMLLLLLPVLPLGAQAKGKAPKAPKAAPVEAPAPKPVRWDGEWTLVEAGSADLATEIPEHVKDLNFALKPYWKRKLEKACPKEGALSLLMGGNLSVTFGKELPLTLQGDGSAVKWKRADGEAFQATLTKEAGKLVMVFEGDGYTLRRVAIMDEDGATFSLRTTYQSPKCPAGDFTYKVIYKRKD